MILLNICVLLLLLLLCLIIPIRKKYQKYARFNFLLKQFAGPMTLPIIGNAHLFIGRSADEVFMKVARISIALEKFKTFKISFGLNLILFIKDPNDIETLLGGTKHIEKAKQYSNLEPWLKEGLLLSKGQKWFQRRRIITPAFHFKILDQFVEIFDRQSNFLVNNLKKSIEKENILDLYSFITLYTLDVICESAMGVGLNAQTDTQSDYVKAVKTISTVLYKRIFDLRYQINFIFKFTQLGRQQKKALEVLHGFTENIIIARRSELIMNNQNNQNTNKNNDISNVETKRKLTFLDILLQSEIDGKPLSNLDIREEVDTFMFEGHDTTSSAILFFFYNLAIYPDEQQKCYEEICTILGDNMESPITKDHLNRMHYIELCIKETLRLYPSVPAFSRNIIEETNINSQIIPAGTNITISAFHLGRSEELFERAHEFRPERFDRSKNDGKKMHPYAFIPFSAGPRNCIGQKFAILEMKSVAAHLLRNFEFEYSEDYSEPVVLTAELILRTKSPIMFRVKSR